MTGSVVTAIDVDPPQIGGLGAAQSVKIRVDGAVPVRSSGCSYCHSERDCWVLRVAISDTVYGMSAEGHGRRAAPCGWKERAVDIYPTRSLPGFASFAVSPGTEQVPEMLPGERHLITSAMVPARRASIARGRAAAHAALRAIGLDRGPILSGPRREPLWPQGVVGSISHAAESAVALVAPAHQTDGVGVDIEELRRVPELWDHLPRPEEREWLGRLDSENREFAIVKLFSAKECVFKAFYPRVQSFFGFEQASLTPTQSGFTARLMDGLDAEYPSQRVFDIRSDIIDSLVLTSVVLPKTAGGWDGGGTKIQTGGGSGTTVVERRRRGNR